MTNLVIEFPQVNCQPLLGRILLVGDNDCVAPWPLRWLTHWFNNAEGDHADQLLLDAVSVGKGDRASTIHPVKDGVIGQGDGHCLSTHCLEVSALNTLLNSVIRSVRICSSSATLGCSETWVSAEETERICVGHPAGRSPQERRVSHDSDASFRPSYT